MMAFAAISGGMKSFAMPAPEPDKPPILNIHWDIVYKTGLNERALGANHLFYRMCLLIADDFINGLILFTAMRNIMRGADKFIGVLREWCVKANVPYKTLLDFVRVRDEIIDQMLTAGLDLFSSADLALERAGAKNFIDVIARLKHCIYDGYHCNMLLYNDSDDTYYTQQGVSVVKPSLFQESEKNTSHKQHEDFAIAALPRVLLYKELSVKYDRKKFIYTVRCEYVSAMDGYISIDPDMMV
jgi:hypothetical protein